MPGMAIGGFEPRAALPEIDLARETGVDHPLKRPVDGRAANPRLFAADEIEQVVGAQMPFLAQERPENPIALGRAFAACGTQAGKIGKGTIHGHW